MFNGVLIVATQLVFRKKVGGQAGQDQNNEHMENYARSAYGNKYFFIFSTWY